MGTDGGKMRLAGGDLVKIFFMIYTPVAGAVWWGAKMDSSLEAVSKQQAELKSDINRRVDRLEERVFYSSREVKNANGKEGG